MNNIINMVLGILELNDNAEGLEPDNLYLNLGIGT